MNTNHLDADALTQPGGFMDSLVKAITTAINGQGAVEDRNSQRTLDATLAQIGAQGQVRREAQGRTDHLGNLMIQAAGQGIAPGEGSEVDPAILDLATKLADQHLNSVKDAKEAKSAAFTEQKRLNDATINERNAQAGLAGAKGVKIGLDQVLGGLGIGKSAKKPPTEGQFKAVHDLITAKALEDGAIEVSELTGKTTIKDPKRYNAIAKAFYGKYGMDVPEVPMEVPAADDNRPIQGPPDPGIWDKVQNFLNPSGAGTANSQGNRPPVSSRINTTMRDSVARGDQVAPAIMGHFGLVDYTTPPEKTVATPPQVLTPVEKFKKLSGLNPDPNSGVAVETLLGADPAARTAALLRIPLMERKRAINALIQMGIK